MYQTQLSVSGLPFDDLLTDPSPPIDPFCFLGLPFRGGAEPSGKGLVEPSPLRLLRTEGS